MNSRSETIATQYYAYDSLNRIQIATENVTPNGQSAQLSWRQQFGYDRYGNRNFDEANTTTLPKECSNNTEVCAAIRPVVNPSVNAVNNRLNGYTFDAAGNTIQDAELRKFTYDAENKQAKVETVNSGGTVTGTIGQYSYDGEGKRIKKKGYTNNVLTEATIFVYDAAGKLVAEYSSEIASVNDAKVAYLTNDHLGSPRITTDQLGQVIARHDYHPFGEEIGTLNGGSPHRTTALNYTTDNVRQKFTGYERDNETDLDFAQARMYQTKLGRFTAVDPLLESGEPVKPQTWNRYVYCLNNPLNLVDPDGQKWKFADENLQKAFEEAVKAKGDKAWKAYQAIDKAKGTINVGFGDLGKTKFGNTSVSFNTSFETKNGKMVAGTTKLESVSGTITIGNNKEALDTSNFTDLVSASAHEFTHVLSAGKEAGVPSFSGLVPADGVTEKEEKAGKQSFPIESAAFDAQVQAEKAMIAKGNKPVSPDTSLGRANAGFGKLSTPTEKYDYLSKIYTDFKQPRPGSQPPKKK